jgi:GNAT superfamily N-acetyltransferase
VNRAVIRAPRPDDAPAIASLLTELGYPVRPDEMPARLTALSGDSTAIWVAELDGEVVALGTGRLFAAINQDAPVAWLTALVVAERVRRRGVGKQLVAIAEDWARQHGASRLTLTSALHRREAHEFYRRLGYDHTGVRLAKQL